MPSIQPRRQKQQTNPVLWTVEQAYRHDETQPWWTVTIATSDHRETQVIRIRVAPAAGIIDYDAYAKETITNLVERSNDATNLDNTLH